MGRTSTITLRVRWGEADALGIVFYPNIFGWFDMASHELLRGPGQSIGSLLHEGGYSVPIVESGARFLAPAFYDDELVVASTVAALRSRSFRVEHRIDRGDQPIATGFEVRVVARRHPGSPGQLETTSIPEGLRSWLAGE
ncbi:MAG: acyl-CoA thioesterase [Actinomycetota bacterium]